MRAGARVSSPAGPGGWIGSGRYTLGLGAAVDHPVRNSGAGHPGWTGGDAASRERYGALRDKRRDELAAEVEGLAAGDLLPRVRERMDAGDYAGADRLLSAWRAKLRREAGLAKLEAAAEAARAAAGTLPEGWQPEDGISSRTQIGAMTDEQLRGYVESLVRR